MHITKLKLKKLGLHDNTHTSFTVDVVPKPSTLGRRSPMPLYVLNEDVSHSFIWGKTFPAALLLNCQLVNNNYNLVQSRL